MVSTLLCALSVLGCSAASTNSDPVLQGVNRKSAKVPLGANIDGIADWSRTFAFQDLMKQSRPFGSPDKPWESLKNLDANGWPKEDCGVVLMVDMGPVKGLGGTYKIIFKCATTPQIGLAASSGKVENVKRSPDGTVTADLIYPDKADQIMLTFRNTQGGLKGLKVLRPGSDGKVFNKAFLKHLEMFSTLRFMDWAVTNGNKIEKWADRPKVEDASYAVKGVPWEVCLDLANELGTDAWINIPAHADQDYINNLATLCKSRLKPGLKLYIENSNEVWNWGFEQAQFNLQQAKQEVAAGKSDLNFDGDKNEGNWAARRVAKRLMQIRKAFEKAYGSSFASTVRPVLATQIVWPGLWLDEAIKYIEGVHGDPGKLLYGIAGAPYFNLGKSNEKKDLSGDEVLKAMSESVDQIEKECQFEANLKVAKKYKIKFLAYEGGPDTFGPNSIPGKKAASKDPRMQALIERYLKKWYSSGGDLFNYFVAGAGNWDGPYGTWGLTDDMSIQDTPKIKALAKILANGY